MSDDPRFRLLPKYRGFYKCPAENCEHDDHGIFTVVIRSPTGRQQAVWACPEHLPLEVAAALNHLRIKPPPGLD